MDFKLKKIPVFKILLTLVGISVLINIPFFANFYSSAISKNTGDWGAYGSYISGIISILNLVVFIFLTIYVAKLGKANSKTQIDSQRKIMLAQLRQSELNKLIEVLDNSFLITPIKTDKIESLIELHSVTAIKLDNFTKYQKFIFPILNENTVINDFASLINTYDYLNESLITWKNEPAQNKTIHEDFINALILKDKLIEILQEYILNELK